MSLFAFESLAAAPKGAPDSNSTDPVNIIHGTHPELIAYLVLNAWPAHFGLPLLVAIMVFSKKVRRHPTLTNMCITWLVVGLASCILLYTGHTTGPEPPMELCLAQASLLYGVPAMVSSSALILVYQMWSVVKGSRGSQKTPDGPVRMLLMTGTPYFVLVASAIATILVGARHPERVSRNRRFFYCSVESAPLTDFITLFAALLLAATLFFKVWTIRILWRNLRQQGSSLGGSRELQHAFRTIAFASYVILALVLGVVSVGSPASPAPDLIVATGASVVFVIFGTQPDILRAMRFWKKDTTVEDDDDDFIAPPPKFKIDDLA
ncbi:hypothetical protein PLICRDRAFT_34854 [Plicaturopsis crispa FD-325 SS-3]|nr:hypothetical protein PLICRDRAFT_34854 [Plicaturopsis crispa FD-325 SS-3]